MGLFQRLTKRLSSPKERVRGTAPSSTSDLEEIVRIVKEQVPQVTWWQLPVSHPGDDDGLWFFSLPGSSHHVQIESSTGLCPFIIEATRHDNCRTGTTPSEVAAHVVCDLLG